MGGGLGGVRVGLRASERDAERLEFERRHLEFVVGLQDSNREDEGLGGVCVWRFAIFVIG